MPGKYQHETGSLIGVLQCGPEQLTGQAIAAADPHPLMDDAVRFVAERLLADGLGLKPAYTITGGAVPDQRPWIFPRLLPVRRDRPAAPPPSTQWLRM